MLIPFKDIKTMGVINITPDSFSDANSLIQNSEALITILNEFKKIPGLIFDFGFESTAPMNKSIQALEERERFDVFFENIKDIDLSQQWISFDTYRPLNYQYFEDQFKSRYKGCGFIFNDVSGVLDTEILEYLKSKRFLEPFYYIYGNTHIPDRGKVLSHMNYLSHKNIVLETSEKFVKGMETLKSIGLEDKIILDPCFGFGKTYEQNWELINRFDELVISLKKSGVNSPILIGVSKKSFLRKFNPDSLDPFKDAEILHENIIRNLINKKLGHLLFRAHDPFLVESIYARF